MEGEIWIPKWYVVKCEKKKRKKKSLEHYVWNCYAHTTREEFERERERERTLCYHYFQEQGKHLILDEII